MAQTTLVHHLAGWADLEPAYPDDRHLKRSRPSRHQGSAGKLAAFGLVLGLHAACLLAWRASRAPPVPAVVGLSAGSGGVSLTLVRGSAGGPFTSGARTDSVDANEQPAAASADQGMAPPSKISSAGADTPAPGDTGTDHGVGVVGEAADAGAHASAGSGYDPGAYASLAPVSFARVSDPALWDQVKRCFTTQPATSVTLSVVIDDQGQFVDSYKAVDALASSQPSGEAQAIALADKALQACSPYSGLAAGLGRPLTLVVPGAPAP